MKAIKSCTYQIEQQKDSALALVNAMKKFTLFYQGRSVSLEVHYERFNTLLEVLEGYGGELPVQPKQFNEELDYFDDNEKDIQANIYEAKAAAKDRLKGMFFLLSLDRSRYGTFLSELETDKLKGFDN